MASARPPPRPPTIMSVGGSSSIASFPATSTSPPTIMSVGGSSSIASSPATSTLLPSSMFISTAPPCPSMSVGGISTASPPSTTASLPSSTASPPSTSVSSTSVSSFGGINTSAPPSTSGISAASPLSIGGISTASPLSTTLPIGGISTASSHITTCCCSASSGSMTGCHRRNSLDSNLYGCGSYCIPLFCALMPITTLRTLKSTLAMVTRPGPQLTKMIVLARIINYLRRQVADIPPMDMLSSSIITFLPCNVSLPPFRDGISSGCSVNKDSH